MENEDIVCYADIINTGTIIFINNISIMVNNDGEISYKINNGEKNIIKRKKHRKR